MSQFSHDQFDDVQPYRQDEVGKHRAPGSVASAGGASGSSGMLKWVGLLVVAVLVAVAVGWFVNRDGDDDDAPVADDANGQEEIEQDEAGEGEEGAEDEAAEGEENGEGEEPETGLSDEYPVRAVNAGAPDGSAGDLSSRMEELGLQVDQSIDWNPDWGNATTPQVVYPEEAQQELAEAIAAELEIDSVNLSESWSSIVVIIGSEYQPAG